MAEVAFARNFLASLDSKPTKFSADHVEDPRNYPSRGAYILPKMPKPMSKPTASVPGSEDTITVTLRSVRNPPLDIKLPSQPPTTSVHQVKQAVSERTGIPSAKIKVLHRKRPVADSKVLSELVGGDNNGGDGTAAAAAAAAEVEFSVMIMGGAAAAAVESAAASAAAVESAAATAAASAESAAAAEVAGPASEVVGSKQDAEPTATGAAALSTEVFWQDLKSFLMLRVKDEQVAEETAQVFREAWQARQ